LIDGFFGFMTSQKPLAVSIAKKVFDHRFQSSSFPEKVTTLIAWTGSFPPVVAIVSFVSIETF
jgi:hypothetical protein